MKIFFQKKVARFKKFQYLCAEERIEWVLQPTPKSGRKPLKKFK